MIGDTGCGKSLLISKICVPQDSRVVLREIPGSKRSAWQSYLALTSLRGVVFVGDISVPARLPQLAVDVWAMLHSTAKLPILLVLNKLDKPNVLTGDAICRILRLPELDEDAESKARLSVVRTSALTNVSIEFCSTWLARISASQ